MEVGTWRSGRTSPSGLVLLGNGRCRAQPGLEAEHRGEKGIVTRTEPACKEPSIRRLRHGAAVAASHSAIACARKVRRVGRETKWRWRLKVL